MDYEYKIFHGKDMHNKCCGGRAWCVQVNVHYELLFNKQTKMLFTFGMITICHLFVLDSIFQFFYFVGYLRDNMCGIDMAANLVC